MPPDPLEYCQWHEDSRLGSGFAKISTCLQTERSAVATDAGPDEAIVGMDAKTGEVYQPDLSAVLQNRKPRCAFHISGGGFDANPNVILLVRVKLFSFYEVDETEADVPEGDRCTAGEETWSFNYANGEIKRVDNSTVLHVAVAKRPPESGRNTIARADQRTE